MSKTKKVISIVLATVLVMAMATVAIVSSSALEDGEIHVVAGAPELCGSNWDPADMTNQMTFIADKGIYEKVFENVPVGDHAFKVTTNGAWDNGDFNLEGDAMFGGANAIASVTVDGSTVIVGFDGTKALLEIVEPEVVETTAADVETTVADVETTVADVETTVADVETTVADDPVETTVAEPVETTVATEDEPVETTVADEPVETTAVEPVETTVAEPVETTVAEPVETTVADEAEGIVVGGEEYTAKVGDVITYTCTLKTPKAIENVQAVTTYDATKLALVDATAAERFPNMTGVVANASEGAVYFNASEISAGFDFTAGATLITLQFEVLDASYSEIVTTIEEMVEFFGIDYITGGEIVADGVEVAETLTVPVEETTGVVETTTVEVVETTTTVEVVETTVTDVKGTTGADSDDKADVPPTGSSIAIYAVLATLAMAAAAVVVLRKKVNG